MTKKLKCTCIACGKRFTPDLMESPTTDGGARQWAACPRCKKRYTVSHISRQGLIYREELQKHFKSHPEKRKKNAARIEELKRLLQKETLTRDELSN